MEGTQERGPSPAQDDERRILLGAEAFAPQPSPPEDAAILTAFEAVYEVAEVFGELDAARLFAEYFSLLDRARTGRLWDLPESR